MSSICRRHSASFACASSFVTCEPFQSTSQFARQRFQFDSKVGSSPYLSMVRTMALPTTTRVGECAYLSGMIGK